MPPRGKPRNLDPNIRIGEALRTMREKARLSQKDIGEALDLSQSMISRLEAGERRILFEDVVRYCDACGKRLRNIAEIYERYVK